VDCEAYIVKVKTCNVGFKQTMQTLELGQWRSAKTAPALGSELEFWKEVPFLLVLVSTKKEPPDETISKEIFGPEFHQLARSIKGGKEI
jgi:hypothetical protein